MVIGWLHRQSEGGTGWSRVEAAQRDARLPCLLIPQPAHAVLAGELAAALLPSVFGEIPAEIVRAIQMHDSGWAASDAQQIQRLRGSGQGGKAVSFLSVPAAEAKEACVASIDTVEAITKVGAVVVRRHFLLLAGQEPRDSIQAEAGFDRASGERVSEGELDRWTGALGFCDLLSLYLLCGDSGAVEIALAHPAGPGVSTAPRVRLEMEQGMVRFVPPVLRGGSSFVVNALKHPLPAEGPRVESLRWEVL